MRMEPILQGPCWVLLHQAASRRLSVRAMVRVAAGTAADPVPDGGIRILQNRKNIKQIFKGLCVATKFKFRKTPKWGFVFVFEIKSVSLQ